MPPAQASLRTKLLGGPVHPARTRRSTRRLAVLAAFVVSTSALVSTAAVAAPPASGMSVDSGMVQFQVRPTNGDVSALYDALTAAGFDADGGTGDTIFVHGPA